MSGIYSLRMVSLMRCSSAKTFGWARHARQMSTITNRHVVDLRSDTVTRPTPAMRQAMMTAEVGDDVMGEDPTVNELQKVFAEKIGKEAALFVPTCTMANTIAILGHCEGRFSEFILGNESHVYNYEVGATAQFGGVHGCTVPNLPDGTMSLQNIQDKIRVRNDEHQPWTKLICLENTHNRCGGKVIGLEYMKSVRQIADKHNIQLHLDGARVFNASVAMGVPISDIAAPAHTVSAAFSKGLCCPVGSIVAGSQDFIQMSRRTRKALGGGMRQAGIIAAAPLLALETMMDRLKDDHRRAKLIAKAVDDMSNNTVCRIDVDGVHTNIGMIEMIGRISPAQFASRMGEVTDVEKKHLEESITVLMFPFSKTAARYVTHHDINDEAAEKVVKKIKYVIEELASQS